MAETHDPSMSLDVVRAYHYGPRFLVELDIVMAEGTPLRESHDCGFLLQHKIEALASVERCFVHIDYQVALAAPSRGLHLSGGIASPSSHGTLSTPAFHLWQHRAGIDDHDLNTPVLHKMHSSVASPDANTRLLSPLGE